MCPSPPCAAAASNSSLIAAYGRIHRGTWRPHVPDVQWPSGEGDQAERVGRHLGIPIRRIVVDQARFLRLWPYAVWHSDIPPIHPSDTALLAVVQACRADGVKVLLTGEGSDELFGGYPKDLRQLAAFALTEVCISSQITAQRNCSAGDPIADGSLEHAGSIFNRPDRQALDSDRISVAATSR